MAAQPAHHRQSRSCGAPQEGSGFDLPISLAVLGATRQLPPERLAEHAAVGELALDGRIRSVAGTLAVAGGRGPRLVDSYQLATLGTSLRDKLVVVQRMLPNNMPKQACEILDSFLGQVKASRARA